MAGVDQDVKSEEKVSLSPNQEDPGTETVIPLVIVNALGEEKRTMTELASSVPAGVDAEGFTGPTSSSFTADSPYYTSYIEKEMRQFQVLTETLRDISARSKTFGKCGALMAEATRRLALACRFQPSLPDANNSGGDSGGTDEQQRQKHQTEERLYQERKASVGDEMGMVLATLGGVSMFVDRPPAMSCSLNNLYYFWL